MGTTTRTSTTTTASATLWPVASPWGYCAVVGACLLAGAFLCCVHARWSRCEFLQRKDSLPGKITHIDQAQPLVNDPQTWAEEMSVKLVSLVEESSTAPQDATGVSVEMSAIAAVAAETPP